MTEYINQLQNEGDLLISILETYIDMIEALALTNEQWFIEWEDKINKLSVKDHNNKADFGTI